MTKENKASENVVRKFIGKEFNKDFDAYDIAREMEQLKDEELQEMHDDFSIEISELKAELKELEKSISDKTYYEKLRKLKKENEKLKDKLYGMEWMTKDVTRSLVKKGYNKALANVEKVGKWRKLRDVTIANLDDELIITKKKFQKLKKEAK